MLQKLEQGLSHKTIKDVLIVPKMVLKFGTKNKWLGYHPFEVQFPTQREKQSIVVLSRAHQKKIMQYIQEHFTFHNLGVYICLCSSVRKTELILNTPKTKNSIREILMSKDLLKMLKPVKKIVNPTFFVLTNDAKPTEPRT